jgi:hypothetical protein
MASKVTKQLSISERVEVICDYDKGPSQKDIMEKYGISVIRFWVLMSEYFLSYEFSNFSVYFIYAASAAIFGGNGTKLQ